MLIYLNGTFTQTALIDAADRGFRFGDGAFETIAVHEGVPYQLELHLERLKAGLAAIRITDPGLRREDIFETIRRNAVISGFVRIAVSRGAGSHGYLPADNITPTVIIEAFTRHPLKMDSVKLHLCSLRKIPLACLPVNHKLAQGLNSTLARMEAKEHGCHEALMLTTDGLIAEASSANIFWVKDGAIHTPALSTGALAGTTRATILRLAEVAQGEYAPSALDAADEVFITNTNWGVMPVISLGSRTWPIGPATQQLQTLYQEDIAAYAKANRTVA